MFAIGIPLYCLCDNIRCHLTTILTIFVVMVRLNTDSTRHWWWSRRCGWNKICNFWNLLPTLPIGPSLSPNIVCTTAIGRNVLSNLLCCKLSLTCCTIVMVRRSRHGWRSRCWSRWGWLTCLLTLAHHATKHLPHCQAHSCIHHLIAGAFSSNSTVHHIHLTHFTISIKPRIKDINIFHTTNPFLIFRINIHVQNCEASQLNPIISL